MVTRFTWTKKSLIIALCAGLLAISLVAFVAGSGSEDRFEAAVDALQQSSSCEEQRTAVETLRDIGDPRAIPVLKKARKARKTRCIRKQAKQAIKHLEGLQ